MAKGGARKGAGRRKGVPNKITTELKEAILGALEAYDDGQGKIGAQAWFIKLMEENSTAFATLLGKILPAQLEMTGKDGAPLPTPISQFIINGVEVKNE